MRGFNPKARWDREIPAEEPEKADLDERIEVLAYFKAGRIYPRLFSWHEKKYRIRTINYTWQERNGAELTSYFSVNTGADAYQISFCGSGYGWRMNRIL